MHLSGNLVVIKKNSTEFPKNFWNNDLVDLIQNFITAINANSKPNMKFFILSFVLRNLLLETIQLTAKKIISYITEHIKTASG